jgi:RNA polymerase sigma-70 factor (ECF subfamily)
LHEQELIQSLQRGNEQAFAELVDAFKDRVYNTALGLLQNAEDAEDISQEVFIKVFQTVGGFKGEAQLSTWIYRITVTHSLDFLRRKGRKKRSGFLISLFEKKSFEVPEFHHPGVAAEQKENAALLFSAIRDLPEQQQAAFLLQKMEGLSQREIAAVLKTSEGAVESLLQRAKTNLKKVLAAHFK